MQTTTTALETFELSPVADHWTFKFAGLAVATLMPALFWTAVAASVGHAAGMALSSTTLALLATSIALFLGAVCAPIMLKPAR